MLDRIISVLMIFGAVFALLYCAFELGRKNQCERDLNYRYSLDYSSCVRLGLENLK